MNNVVILGGGVAGTTVAEGLRKLQPDVAITIIEQEHYPLYSRVLLPHYIKGKIPREKVFLKTLDWYRGENIELMLGVTVERIDLVHRFVCTSEGRELPFDALVLASGGELKTLGGEPRGVSYLRSLDDADHLLTLIREVKMKPLEEQNAVVIGGGFIALEYINIFFQAQIPCTVVVRGEGFWSSILSEHSQHVLARQVKAHNIPLYQGELSPEILGHKEVSGVRLSAGTVLPCAMVGVGIGMELDRFLYEESGVEIGRGIVTNEYLETQYAQVYAVGDCADFFDVHAGRRVMYGNWMNAQMQARTLVKTLHGERTIFAGISSYATNLLGMHIVFLGDVDRQAADEVRQVVQTAHASQEEFYRHGRLVGALLIGDVTARASLTERLKNGG